MFGSEILDVAIGLVLIFLLLSLICSSAREAIEAVLKDRAGDLERGIGEMLNDRDRRSLLPNVYQHPLINGLFKGDYKAGKTRNLPSYIPPRAFALAIVDIVKSSVPQAANTVANVAEATTATARAAADFKDAVLHLPQNSDLRSALLPLIEAAGNDMSRVRQNIEDWYNATMDRVSGWYKRRTQIIIAILGFAIAGIMNVDAIAIMRYLNTNQTARSIMVAEAERRTEHAQPSSSDLEHPLTFLERQGGIPLGWVIRRGPNQSEADFERDWRRAPNTLYTWLLKIAGILFTGFAVSLGAPFWFDVLNRFMVIRSTIKPQEKSPEEKSKD
jgi:hypothetical protein